MVVHGGGAHNEVAHSSVGAVVQAGSIGHVSVNASPVVDVLVPRQLPLATPGFTGRTDVLEQLDLLLLGARSSGNAATISAVGGTAGVGKTALAIHWAHRAQRNFPDGTLFVNLDGYSSNPPIDPASVLEDFLHALGVPIARIPQSMSARAALYRSVLAGRRVLIVLDNACSAEQVRPLLPADAECAALITSRTNLSGLAVNEGVARVPLDLLSDADAGLLVRTLIGEERYRAESNAVAEVVRLCAGLPLALRVTIAHLAERPHATLADAVADLANEQERLDVLSTSPDRSIALRSIFEWSYRRLAETERRTFRRMALHPGAEMSLEAAAVVASLDVVAARRSMDELVDAGLVHLVARNRYRLHDLLRLYAGERCRQDDTLIDCVRAEGDVIEWYAHWVLESHKLRAPAYSTWQANPCSGLTDRPALNLGSGTQAWQWFDEERENLIAAVHAAARTEKHNVAFLLARMTGFSLNWRGQLVDALRIHEVSLDAARATGDALLELCALVGVGEIQANSWHLGSARSMFELALELASRCSSAFEKTVVLNDLGSLCLQEGNFVEAMKWLTPVLPLCAGSGNPRLEGVVEVNLSRACRGLGRHEEAVRHAERSLQLRGEAGDGEGMAFARMHMARALMHLDEHERAIELCREALTLDSDSSHPPALAETLETLGELLHLTGREDEAFDCWRQALAILERLGADDDVVRVRRRLSART